MEKITKFLDEFNITYQDHSDNIQIDCLLCTDNRKRLGIAKAENSTTRSHAWRCFNCNSKGLSLESLKKAHIKLKSLGREQFVEKSKIPKKYVKIPVEHCEKMNHDLKKISKAVDYITKTRNLSPECIDYFKLGFRNKFYSKKKQQHYDGGPHLAIPFFEGDRVVNYKYRLLVEPTENRPKWRREEGGKTVLFNNEVLYDMDIDEVFLCESEIDSMSLWSAGFKNVVGLSAGAQTFPQEWFDAFERFNKIYLVLDNDIAGQEGAKEIAGRLGMNKCYNIILPDEFKDPNDYFKTNTSDDFKSLIRKAKRFNVESVVDLGDIIIQAMNDNVTSNKSLGLTPPWKAIDNVLGEVIYGGLYVVGAKPKVSKTNFVLNWLLKEAEDNGLVSFNYQCEMEEQDMLDRYLLMRYPNVIPEKVNVKVDDYGQPIFLNEDHKTQYERYKEARSQMYRWAFMNLPVECLKSYHPKSQAELELDVICEKIKKSVRRYGCKIVVFDNLHFLCRGENSKEKVEKTTQRFKLLARELGVVFFIVTHVKKTNNNRAPSNEDLKDSGAIFQDADAVIMMHREVISSDTNESEWFGEVSEESDENRVQSAMSPVTQFLVTARRHKGGSTYMTLNDNLVFADSGDFYTEQMQEFYQKKRDIAKAKLANKPSN